MKSWVYMNERHILFIAAATLDEAVAAFAAKRIETNAKLENTHGAAAKIMPEYLRPIKSHLVSEVTAGTIVHFFH